MNFSYRARREQAPHSLCMRIAYVHRNHFASLFFIAQLGDDLFQNLAERGLTRCHGGRATRSGADEIKLNKKKTLNLGI